MSRPKTRVIMLLAVALAVVAFAACRNGGSPTEEPDCTLESPVSFPYIFSGNLTVDGEPGPVDVPVFARLGDCRGSFNNTRQAGRYSNVVVSAVYEEDIGDEITFHLGHPDGPNVQADQTYVFVSSSQPQLITFDLNFPRLP